MKKIIGITIIIVICFAVFFGGGKRTSNKNVVSWRDFNIVAHSSGAVNGLTHTNSITGIIANYALGNRVFEIDLFFTDDHQLVGLHPEHIYKILPNYENGILAEDLLSSTFFKNSNIIPLCFESLVLLMIEKPDIYIVTDTKQINKEGVQKQFNHIYEVASRIDKNVLDRIIPQIYFPEMYDTIEEIYPFNEYIWALYQIPYHQISQNEIFEFVVKREKIVALSIPEWKPWLITKDFLNDLYEIDVLVYVHTLNNINDMLKFWELGVWGFYSNFITEGYIKQNRLLKYSR